MSTYYYLACDEHHTISEIVARVNLMADWNLVPFGLERFLSEHGSCKPVLITEHDDRADTYEKVMEN